MSTFHSSEIIIHLSELSDRPVFTDPNGIVPSGPQTHNMTLLPSKFDHKIQMPNIGYGLANSKTHYKFEKIM